MVSKIRRKTSLTLDGEALDCAKELGLNISAVAEAALVQAVAAARREKWLAENADAMKDLTAKILEKVKVSVGSVLAKGEGS